MRRKDLTPHALKGQGIGCHMLLKRQSERESERDLKRELERE